MPSVATQITPFPLIADEARRQLAAQVDSCVRWLEIQGFTILRIERNRIQPRITIRYSPLCDKLEGVTSHFERGNFGIGKGFLRRYKQVTRLDCEVRWADGEASHA